ncbi:hypothetical protein [Erythrobacter sp. HKB08]|uniref:hypothetical protein n=1 Tax=Erythrobacter sp. HKB08 TaxID=2502843 RepID=UPI00100876F1|nr:hypothetical protein [Erythrobacter sp. HKB08]
MLTALLSARATTGEPSEFIADMRIGADSLVAHQVRQAVEIGCERIICLADMPRGALLEAQHIAEKAGVTFQTARSANDLSRLVRADDRVVVLAEGLMPDTELLASALAKGQFVAGFDAEPAIQRGFERIDLTRAWGGALAVRGTVFERLQDLPDDIDILSALLRIALQADVKSLRLSEDELVSGNWKLVRTSAEAAEIRQARLNSLLSPRHWLWPVKAVGERIGLEFARRGASRTVVGGATIVGLLALFGAPFVAATSYAWAGFALLIVGLVIVAGSDLLDRATASGGETRASFVFKGVRRILADFSLAGCVVAAGAIGLERELVFAAIVLVLGLNLSDAINTRQPVPVLGDRGVVSAIMLAALATTAYLPIVQALGALFLLVGLFLSYRSKLTRA